ncbi:hypothetical protein K431DRAFT_219670, partial [Polychaeton citri CBS 116435]
MISLLASIALASYVTSTAAHSWIEQMQVIGSNGSYVGDYGYPRGYVERTSPGFSDPLDLWQQPKGYFHLNGSEILCHPSQRTANYSADYPRLNVSPGDYVAMKYQENGHVTQPWIKEGKPYGGGTIFVYGTYQPEPDTKLVDVLKWNGDGTGGNKQGWLMTAQNFDDERCHEISDAPISLFRAQANPNPIPGSDNAPFPQWCETDLKIPEDVKGSSLTAYWVWQWNTAPEIGGGQDEYYITCADFDV